MRQKRILQRSIFDQFTDHQIGHELEAMSDFLDRRREIVHWVCEDTVRVDPRQTGNRGIGAESILRCAVVK